MDHRTEINIAAAIYILVTVVFFITCYITLYHVNRVNRLVSDWGTDIETLREAGNTMNFFGEISICLFIITFLIMVTCAILGLTRWKEEIKKSRREKLERKQKSYILKEEKLL